MMHRARKTILAGCGALLLGGSALAEAPNEMLIVVGARGEEEFGQTFAAAAKEWQEAAEKGQAKATLIGAESEKPKAQLENYLKEAAKQSPTPLWIVLIGHGTYNKREANFNVAGEDLSAEELKAWLEPFKRPLFIFHTGSCSGPFVTTLSGPNRVIVTATKSGREINATYFVTHLADALLNPEADLDNDGTTSLLELFQFGSGQTAKFFVQETRIATEHALIDDNGDGQGTTIEAMETAKKSANNPKPIDGAYAKRWSLILSKEEGALPADMREKRNLLEQQVEELKQQRATMGEDDYYGELEKLLLQIARLYRDVKRGS